MLNRLFRINNETQPLNFDKFSIKAIEHEDNRYEVMLESKDRKIIFSSATSPETIFTQEPEKIANPIDINTLNRVLVQLTKKTSVEALERSWIYKNKRGITFLGTADHHELYFFLLNNENSNPQDILLSFDSHDDIDQNSIDPNNNWVDIANFVGVGFFPTVKKTWNHFFLVANEKTHGSGMKNFPKNAERYKREQYLTTLDKALKMAKKKKSKIIISVDLDFFGSRDIVEFDPQFAAAFFIDLFRFIQINYEHIRIVHFAESLAYSIKMNDQVAALYRQISALLTIT